MPGFHWLPDVLKEPLLEWRARRDAERLLRREPGLVEPPGPVRRVEEMVETELPRYLEEAGTTEVMAASDPLCRFLVRWVGVRRPRRIADLGSGFSSYLFRRCADAFGGRDVEVVSVDDDREWLERSRGFAARSGLDGGRFLSWTEFRTDPGAPFDLVFCDLGSVRDRAARTRWIFGLVSRQGSLIYDDIHKARLWRAARRAARILDFRGLSLRARTLDCFGRFSWLAWPRNDGES